MNDNNDVNVTQASKYWPEQNIPIQQVLQLRAHKAAIITIVDIAQGN